MATVPGNCDWGRGWSPRGQAESVPVAPQAWHFVLVLGVGKVVAILRLLSCSKEQIAKDLLSGEEEETQSSADDLTPSVTSQEASDLFRNQSGCRCHRPLLHHGPVSHRHTHTDWAWGLCRGHAMVAQGGVGVLACELSQSGFELREIGVGLTS